jgi:hypothetical protein
MFDISSYFGKNKNKLYGSCHTFERCSWNRFNRNCSMVYLLFLVIFLACKRQNKAIKQVDNINKYKSTFVRCDDEKKSSISLLRYHCIITASECLDRCRAYTRMMMTSFLDYFPSCRIITKKVNKQHIHSFQTW